MINTMLNTATGSASGSTTGSLNALRHGLHYVVRHGVCSFNFRLVRLRLCKFVLVPHSVVTVDAGIIVVNEFHVVRLGVLEY